MNNRDDNREWFNFIPVNNEPCEEDEDEEYDSEYFSDMESQRSRDYDQYHDENKNNYDAE